MLTSTDQYWPLVQVISRWGGVSSRKATQGPAPFQLETFPQLPCLVLMREGSVPGGQAAISFCQLSPVITTAEGRFCCRLPLPLHLLGGGLGSEFGRVCSPVWERGRLGSCAPCLAVPAPPSSAAPAASLHTCVWPGAAPTPRPRPALVQAGKMQPVSPEEKPNPLQDANVCSRLFSW